MPSSTNQSIGVQWAIVQKKKIECSRNISRLTFLYLSWQRAGDIHEMKANKLKLRSGKKEEFLNDQFEIKSIGYLVPVCKLSIEGESNYCLLFCRDRQKRSEKGWIPVFIITICARFLRLFEYIFMLLFPFSFEDFIGVFL